MIKDRSPALRMSEREKQQTYQAAALAINIINQKSEALNKYRNEVLSNLDRYEGNVCFTFNMDFMKVTRILVLGYMQNQLTRRRTREWQVSAESLKIAKETGASYQEVKKLFLLLMNRYI